MDQNSISEKWFIVCNPVAGKGAVSKLWPQIEKVFTARNIDYEQVWTTHRGHATSLVKEAIQYGYNHFIAVGGDGTGNEVVNGIFQQDSDSTITYTLLPVGTGNDWVKHHRIPRRLTDWVDMLQRSIVRWQDVGWVSYQKDGQQQRRYFVNVAGLAYDAFVVREMATTRRRLPSRLHYMYMALKGFWGFRPVNARVEIDDHSIDDRFYLINAGICKYSGGGMQLVPHADSDDGLLAITVAAEIGPMDVILNLPAIYGGTLDKNKRIQSFQAKQLKVSSLESEPVWIEVDGEFLGHSPIEVGIVPKALKVLVPS